MSKILSSVPRTSQLRSGTSSQASTNKSRSAHWKAALATTSALIHVLLYFVKPGMLFSLKQDSCAINQFVLSSWFLI